MKSSRKYFFICGCARSGTTALWKLMTAHSDVVIGMERFSGLVQGKFSLCEDVFNEDRFFNLKPNETHYDNLYTGLKGVYYKNVAQRFSKALIYGDKIPSLYNNYSELNNSFPNVKIIFIFRNIFDVASSFNARAAQAVNWPKTKDYKVAVTHWNKSLQSTLHYINTGGEVLCLAYEDFLWEAVNSKSILNFLDLPVSKDFDSKLNFLIKKNKESESSKFDTLTANQKKYITLEADFESYKKLVQLSKPK